MRSKRFYIFYIEKGASLFSENSLVIHWYRSFVLSEAEIASSETIALFMHLTMALPNHDNNKVIGIF